MNVDYNICQICKESFTSSKGITVGDTGRKTLLLSSVERRDGLHEIFENLTPLRVQFCLSQGLHKTKLHSGLEEKIC